MQHTVSNFVFDFGAVVFEWDPVKRVEEHFQGEWYGHASAQALAKSIFGHHSWHSFDQGVNTLESVIEQSSKRLGIEPKLLTLFIEPIGEDLAPIESSISVLESLLKRRQSKEDTRLFYLSNMPAPFARVLERKHRFLEWFDGGIFSADVLLAKPDKKIYNLLADQFKLSPESTVFIDDQLLNIQAAESLGWSGIHLPAHAELAEKIERFL
jgi:putative hydrolase of the HAD superfamily